MAGYGLGRLKNLNKLDNVPNRGILGDNLGGVQANEIFPGGNGQSIAGHGFYIFGDGDVVIQKGTTVIVPRENIKIHDVTGRILEVMDADAFAAGGKKARQKILRKAFQEVSKKAISNKEIGLLNPKNTAIKQTIINRVKDDIKGLRILKAGDKMENLTFKEPSNLSIFENSTTFLNDPHQPVKLNNLLKEDLSVNIL